MSPPPKAPEPLVVRAWAWAWAWLGRRFGRGRLRLDEGCDAALGEVLRELGASVSEEEWGVAGAIEHTRYTITLGEVEARLNCYSYEGPILTGDPALLKRIAERLAAR